MLNNIIKSQKTNNKVEKTLNTHSKLPSFLIFRKITTHSNRKVEKKKGKTGKQTQYAIEDNRQRI